MQWEEIYNLVQKGEDGEGGLKAIFYKFIRFGGISNQSNPFNLFKIHSIPKIGYFLILEQLKSSQLEFPFYFEFKTLISSLDSCDAIAAKERKNQLIQTFDKSA